MTIDQEEKCSQGPTDLLPDIPQCPNKPTEYVFGEPCCKECADKLRGLHLLFCKPLVN